MLALAPPLWLRHPPEPPHPPLPRGAAIPDAALPLPLVPASPDRAPLEATVGDWETIKLGNGGATAPKDDEETVTLGTSVQGELESRGAAATNGLPGATIPAACDGSMKLEAPPARAAAPSSSSPSSKSDALESEEPSLNVPPSTGSSAWRWPRFDVLRAIRLRPEMLAAALKSRQGATSSPRSASSEMRTLGTGGGCGARLGGPVRGILLALQSLAKSFFSGDGGGTEPDSGKRSEGVLKLRSMPP
mmetsp:Transcript_73381/g.203737  ORF Transcript_73381/g.203737 Transcript_73381/m.203737 type:complete len:247 (-) Transcript_73381:1156-1896(-)